MKFAFCCGALLVVGARFPGTASLSAAGAVGDRGIVSSVVLHSDPVAPILLALVFIAFAGALGGYAMKRLGQPAVLGELLVGMVVANLLYYFHYPVMTVLREGPVILDIVSRALTENINLGVAARQVLPDTSSSLRIVEVFKGPSGATAVTVYQFVDQLSRIAVIVLLFLVGLETDIREMKRVGTAALIVALGGMLGPLMFGALAMVLLQPTATIQAHLFVGCILTATSVGISARVFRDLGATQRPESRIVLGAAVVDDVLSLILLAVATGLVVTGTMNLGMVAGITARATLFLLVSIGVGLWAVPRLLRKMAQLGIANLYLLFGLGFAFVLSWLANRAGLATIVGAFAAGLVLGDFFSKQLSKEHSLRDLLSPLESLIVPVYFVWIGMQVKLETFASWSTVLVALALTVAAVLGKLIVGAVCSSRLSRLSVGIGMIPRGEVGLIFASIGRSLGVVSDATFSAVVAMVIVTTFLAPPLLKWSLARKPQSVGGIPAV